MNLLALAELMGHAGESPLHVRPNGLRPGLEIGGPSEPSGPTRGPLSRHLQPPLLGKGPEEGGATAVMNDVHGRKIAAKRLFPAPSHLGDDVAQFPLAVVKIHHGHDASLLIGAVTEPPRRVCQPLLPMAPAEGRIKTSIDGTLEGGTAQASDLALPARKL